MSLIDAIKDIDLSAEDIQKLATVALPLLLTLTDKLIDVFDAKGADDAALAALKAKRDEINARLFAKLDAAAAQEGDA